MDEATYNDLCADLGSTCKGIMALAASREAFCAPDYYRMEGTGNHGLTGELEQLCKLGLIRPIGRRPSGRGGPPPMHYERVDREHVDHASKSYQPRKRKRRAGSQSRISEPKVAEQGDIMVWIRTRKAAVQLIGLLTTMLPSQSLWRCIPDGDLELIVDLLVELDEAEELTLDALWLRVEDDDLRAKIAKLLDTRGREPEEARSYRRLAEKMKRKRIVRD